MNIKNNKITKVVPLRWLPPRTYESTDPLTVPSTGGVPLFSLYSSPRPPSLSTLRETGTRAMISPRRRWPRGPRIELHTAACFGSAEATIDLLSAGSINVDHGDPKGWTPLMYAAQEGHSRIARILLSKGANVSTADDDGVSALHLSALNGHLAMTTDLITADADVNARDSRGDTPLHVATQQGHTEVMKVLLEAGADVDSRAGDGSTPLCTAANFGRLDAVRELLRANGDPLLSSRTPADPVPLFPLVIAAYHGHSEVVRELVHHIGAEGCRIGNAGQYALNSAAAENQSMGVMEALRDGGVVDNGSALFVAVEYVREVAVKWLLQQWPRRGTTVKYANIDIGNGLTPLVKSIDVSSNDEGKPHLISPRVVRLLIEAGASTSSIVRIKNAAIHEVVFEGTPLAFTNDCIQKKRVGIGGSKATAEQMYRLEAVRRLLMREEAVHAVSWLWVKSPLLVSSTSEASSRRIARKTPASGPQLKLMLPLLRRRRRGVLCATLFR